MREIPLTRGQIALVDDGDYESLAKHKWCASFRKKTKTFVAVRATPRIEGKRIILMHREIMGLEFGDKRKVDHIDRPATLNNQRSNLRIATNAENMWNSGIRPHNKSGYKGVFWSKSAERWTSQIRCNGIKHHLGYFDTAKDAYAAYCAAALRLHGEFASL